MMDLWLPPKPAIIRPAAQDVRQFGDPKKANFLPGWFPGGAVAGPAGPSLSVVANATDGGSGTTDTDVQIYTFSSVAFGAAAADRLLIMAVAGGSTATSVTLGSVTIGGITATIHAQANNSGNTRNGHAAVVSATVPTGTSGTIVVTWSVAGVGGPMLDTSYALYRVTGLVSTTPTDTATATGGSPTMNIDRSNNGFIVAAANAVSASAVTWPSPLVTDQEVSTDGTFSSLGHSPVTAGAVTNFNAGPSTPGGAGPSRYAAASWA
jgi:hypothetical protein